MACRDHLPLESRHDVIAFKSEALEEPVEVIGPIEVKLWVSSDAPDTDFTAKLIDEYPPNIDYPYGLGVRGRHTEEKASMCASRDNGSVPREAYDYGIELFRRAGGTGSRASTLAAVLEFDRQCNSCCDGYHIRHMTHESPNSKRPISHMKIGIPSAGGAHRHGPDNAQERRTVTFP